MQVSWIDQDDLRELVDGLRRETDSSQGKKGLAWELHTLPESAFEIPPDDEGRPMDVGVGEVEPAVQPPEESLPQEQISPAAVEEIRDRLKSVREKALGAGLLKRPQPEPEDEGSVEPLLSHDPGEPKVDETTPSPGPAAPDFHVPAGPVPLRLDAYAAWAGGWLGESQIFLLDEEGHLLWGVQAKSGLVLSAVLAWSAARHASAVEAVEVPAVIRQSAGSAGAISLVPCRTRHGMIQVGIQRQSSLTDLEAGLLREALAVAMDAGESDVRD
jgi:hypothetical protein